MSLSETTESLRNLSAMWQLLGVATITGYLCPGGACAKIRSSSSSSSRVKHDPVLHKKNRHIGPVRTSDALEIVLPAGSEACFVHTRKSHTKLCQKKLTDLLIVLAHYLSTTELSSNRGSSSHQRRPPLAPGPPAQPVLTSWSPGASRCTHCRHDISLSLPANSVLLVPLPRLLCAAGQ